MQRAIHTEDQGRRSWSTLRTAPNGPPTESRSPHRIGRGLSTRLDEWESAGLLTHGQVEAIHDFEDTRPVVASHRYGRLITIIGILAVFLIGSGVAQMVAANWDGIPDAAKLGLLVVGVVGFEVAGWQMHQKATYPRTGIALILLGFLLYGSGIHLIAQTYNRPLDDPMLMLWWFLPALPLAHLVRSGVLALAGVGVGYAALGFRLADWLENVDGPLLWAAPYMATAAALVAIGSFVIHRRSDSPAAGYGIAGAATATVLLYIGGYRFWYDDWSRFDAAPVQVLVLMAVATLGAVGIWVLRYRRDGVGRQFATDTVVIGGLLGFAWLWAVGANVPWLTAFAVTNIALLGMIVWLVTLGVIHRRESFVNLGVLVFAIALFSRYIEIAAGMMGTGVSFFGTGLVLLALAIGLESGRRKLLAAMEEGDDDER